MINLLPRKEFEIILEGKTIKGKFGNWALDRFRKITNLKLSEVQAAFEDNELNKELCVKFLMCAIEYSSRLESKEFDMTEEKTYALIDDELGGFEGKDFIDLFKHAGDENKKKAVASNGKSTNVHVTLPGFREPSSGEVIRENAKEY